MNNVPRIDDSPADALMGEIVDDFLERLARNETPDIEDYAQRYPKLATVLRQMLPTLQLVHEPGMGRRLETTMGAGPVDAGALEPEGPLGDYRLVREIGRGGMGVVYEAVQISLGRRVALKVLPFAAALDSRQLQRFKNEAQAAAHLHHQNIVPVYGVGCERAVHFYAMQFIEGQTLAQVILDLRLQNADLPKQTASPATPTQSAICNLESAMVLTPPVAGLSTEQSVTGPAFFRSVARLGMQAAQALDYSHEMGVVHRDVKPANLMLDDRGKIWINDFGLAHCQSQAGLTMSGDLVGTLRYMSPEQALAKRVIVDHRTDIYSLGATLYELLTMEPVFPGADRQELLRQIAFEEPKAPRRHKKSIPAELETIVLKALEKNPADRYGTAKEMAEDLERFMKDEPIRARRPSLKKRLKQSCRRHKLPVTGVVAIMLTALLGSGGLSWWHAQQRSTLEQAVADELKDAERWQREERWSKALHALERAATRLETIGPGPLQDQVDNRRREVALVDQLEKARLQALTVSGRRERDYAAADRAYSSAFLENSLDVAARDEAVRLIRDSAIRKHLVRALDNWAFCKDHMVKGGGDSLRAIAQAADDDPWRRLLRESRFLKDRLALEALAEGEAVLDQPPENLLILFALLENARARATGLRLLRRAQQLHPADFWINYELGLSLADSRATAAEAVAFCRAALAIQPQSPVVYLNLANALGAQGIHKELEAEAACRKAIAVQSDCTLAYIHLGYNQLNQGKLPEAEAAFRRAMELKSGYGNVFLGLGPVLTRQGKLPEAEQFYREAAAAFRKDIERDSHNGDAHNNLGCILCDQQHKYPEAEAAFRKAIELNPDSAQLHNNLGHALRPQGRLPEAEAAYRKAIDLQPDRAEFHRDLGDTLTAQQNLPQAVAAFRKAIDLNPELPGAHFSLGYAMQDQKNMPEAATAYRKAIDLKPDHAEAHCNLGRVLEEQGEFADALASRKRGHELGSQKANWSYPSAEWVRRAEQLVVLDAKLPNVLSGATLPADAAERVALADLCQRLSRRLYAASARFYTEAFAAEPKLADDSTFGHRYNAACAAALASCGQGKDAAQLEAKERGSLRGQALAWLRAELVGRRLELEKKYGKARLKARQQMRHWQQDSDFDGVRAEAALAKLPQAEREEWRKLWREVEELERRAAEVNINNQNFVRAWLVLSELVPYAGTDGAKALDEQQIPGEALLRPRAGDPVQVSGKTLVWKEHHSAELHIDFAALYGDLTSHRLAYAVCYVHTDADRNDLVLRAGSDDQAKLYVNGKEVYRQPKARGLDPDQDEIPITLRKGSNVLVFKVVNQGDPGPEGSLHFVTKDGRAADGLRFGLEPE